ncbi:MAG TPA: tetratricopeptide repeat protein [Pyrinomonadaceae bacterium]|jgi:CheY-like chemotaxis protein
MTLAESLLRQLDDPTLSHDERAQLRCQIAADFEHRGQYAAAREALGELWRGVGQRPTLEGLTERTSAEALLRAGTLSGWLGSVKQIEGAQDAAKDLISESMARFKGLAETTKVAAAQSELGLCYRRAGAYGEARVLYGEALKSLTDSTDLELRIKILLRLITVESCSGRYNDALRILTESTELFEQSASDVLKGKFHNELGLVLRKLGTAERRPDYTDRAIIEYTAAAFHFEEAGHTSYRARAENNLGFLLYTVGRYEDAHEHLNNARILFLAVKDKGSVAQVYETRARVLLAQGRTKEAERAIREAIQVLAKGGEQGLYAEALTTQGRVLAKLGNFPESRNTLRKAANVAEAAGAVEDAGRALLTLIEEHGERISERELLEAYRRADNLLKQTQDAETIACLRACASRIVAARLAALPPQRRRSTADFWAGFNLPEKVHAYEGRYIRRALIDAKGSITHAARLLGWDYHGTLQSMLDEGGRHHDLAHLRTPLEKRKKSIIGVSRAKRRRGKRRVIKILHVEDYELVAQAVRDTLESLGWKVESCADGAEAMKILAGDEPYNVLIFDYDLPGRNGIELTRHARSLPHRRRTPIIMFSAGNIGQAAWRAGASAVLRKPEEVGRLSETVTRLLSKDTTGRQ